MSQADEVFFITGEEIRPLASRPFKSGLFGRTLEDALQTLIERQPNILNGRQIEPGSADPPKFVLLCRETRVGDWSLDHLLVDQRGVLTLVEAKLLQNPEARRAVIGQILDYAAGAIESWSDGQLKLLASNYWGRQNRTVDDVLRLAFGDIDTDVFWAQVESNLKQSLIRLIIAADELQPEVRRVIEFLNGQMRTIQVFGLEIRCFGEEPTAVIVPFLVGQSQKAAAQKTVMATSGAKVWTSAELEAAYSAFPDMRKGDRLLRLLRWSVSRNCVLTGRTQTPVFGLRGRSGQRIVSVSPDYGVYCYVKPERYPTVEDRDQFVRDLKDAGMFQEDFDASSGTDGKNFGREVGDLTEEELSTPLEIFSKYTEESRALLPQ